MAALGHGVDAPVPKGETGGHATKVARARLVAVVVAETWVAVATVASAVGTPTGRPTMDTATMVAVPPRRKAVPTPGTDVARPIATGLLAAVADVAVARPRVATAEAGHVPALAAKAVVVTAVVAVPTGHVATPHVATVAATAATATILDAATVAGTFAPTAETRRLVVRTAGGRVLRAVVPRHSPRPCIWHVA